MNDFTSKRRSLQELCPPAKRNNYIYIQFSEKSDKTHFECVDEALNILEEMFGYKPSTPATQSYMNMGVNLSLAGKKTFSGYGSNLSDHCWNMTAKEFVNLIDINFTLNKDTEDMTKDRIFNHEFTIFSKATEDKKMAIIKDGEGRLTGTDDQDIMVQLYQKFNTINFKEHTVDILRLRSC